MTDQKTTGEVRQPIQRGYQQIILACGATIKSASRRATIEKLKNPSTDP
jgi:hypothetical protein